MLESDPKILMQLNAIENPGFVQILRIANECSDYRGLPLEFRVGNPEVWVSSEERITSVSLLADPSNRTLEHDAAHELCHVIANCCGFSYNIDISDESLLKQLNNDQQIAVCKIMKLLGSFLTHAVVHKLLQATGYDRQDWDTYLIKQVSDGIVIARNSANPMVATMESRAINVGWAVQYEELDNLRLPGLDVKELKRKLRELFNLRNSNFDTDFGLIRRAAKIDNILDVQGCLESTRSLAAAFGKLLLCPVEKLLTIQIACKPSKEWSLDAVTKRLKEAKG